MFSSSDKYFEFDFCVGISFWYFWSVCGFLWGCVCIFCIINYVCWYGDVLNEYVYDVGVFFIVYVW